MYYNLANLVVCLLHIYHVLSLPHDKYIVLLPHGDIVPTKCYSCKSLIQEKDVFHGLHLDCFCKEFNIPQKVDFENVAIKDHVSDLSKKNESRISFFHGMFRKYSVSLNGQSYILKVKENNYEELPVTEYLCNQIAKQLGFNVPKFCLIEFENSITAFVTQNFMSDYVASSPSSRRASGFFLLKSHGLTFQIKPYLYGLI